MMMMSPIQIEYFEPLFVGGSERSPHQLIATRVNFLVKIKFCFKS